AVCVRGPGSTEARGHRPAIGQQDFHPGGPLRPGGTQDPALRAHAPPPGGGRVRLAGAECADGGIPGTVAVIVLAALAGGPPGARPPLPPPGSPPPPPP